MSNQARYVLQTCSATNHPWNLTLRRRNECNSAHCVSIFATKEKRRREELNLSFSYSGPFFLLRI